MLGIGERQDSLAAFLSCGPEHQSVESPRLLSVYWTAATLASGQATQQRHRRGRQGAGDMTLVQVQAGPASGWRHALLADGLTA